MAEGIVDEVAGAFLCGGILIRSGACVLFSFLFASTEFLWQLGGMPAKP